MLLDAVKMSLRELFLRHACDGDGVRLFIPWANFREAEKRRLVRVTLRERAIRRTDKCL